MDTIQEPDQAKLSAHAERAAPSRAFGLRGASSDPELESLLGLAQWLSDDIETAVVLSSITGPRLRDHFPAGQPVEGVIRCRSGLNLRADMSDIFASSAAFGRLQEADDFEAFMSLIEPGAVVVDIGANFGVYAAHAALYAGASGQVFAFEPLPTAHALLAANVADNGLNCRPVRAAVGAENGVASFRVAEDSSFSGLKDTGRSKTLGQTEVEVIALDQFAPLERLKVDLIKIDVEGGEQAVLRGARNLLARAPDVLVMFEFSYKNLDAVARAELIAELDSLGELGLRLYRRNPVGRGVEQLAPAALQGALSENMFLVRPDSAMAGRLAAVTQRPAPSPSHGEVVALSVLRRFNRAWRTSEELSRMIRDSAEADFGLKLTGDLASDFKAYRDVVQEAAKQHAEARRANEALTAALDRHRAALEEAHNANKVISAALESHRAALEEAHNANKVISAALEGHRTAMANTQSKYEDASAARDWLIGQIAELKARHGIVEPDPSPEDG